MVKWYKKAVEDKPPNTLNGWKKTKSAASRRSSALSSRSKNWSLRHRRRSAGQALQALANVTTDKATKKRAGADARYFFSKL